MTFPLSWCWGNVTWSDVCAVKVVVEIGNETAFFLTPANENGTETCVLIDTLGLENGNGTFFVYERVTLIGCELYI